MSNVHYIHGRRPTEKEEEWLREAPKVAAEQMGEQELRELAERQEPDGDDAA